MLIKAKYSRIIARASWLELFNWTTFKFRCFAIARVSSNRLADQVSWQLKQLFSRMVSFFMDSQSTRNF